MAAICSPARKRKPRTTQIPRCQVKDLPRSALECSLYPVRLIRAKQLIPESKISISPPGFSCGAALLDFVGKCSHARPRNALETVVAKDLHQPVLVLVSARPLEIIHQAPVV